MSDNPQPQGETLAQRLIRGPIEPGTALSYLEQLLAILQPLHSSGGVHGHITPEVIHLTPEGRATLTGVESRDSTEGTGTGGTGAAEGPLPISDDPGYMAPEQLNGDFTDARADVFALGVIAYEMLVGKNPFSAGEDLPRGTVIYRIVYRPYPEIAAGAVAGLSEEFRRVVSTAMAKDAASRFADAGSFLAALEWSTAAAASTVPVAVPAAVAPAAASTAMVASAVKEEGGFGEALAAWLFEVRRNSAPYFVAASIVLVALAVVLVVLLAKPQETTVNETILVVSSTSTSTTVAAALVVTTTTLPSPTTSPTTTSSSTGLPSSTTGVLAKVPAIISLTALSQVYDGSPRAAAVVTSPEGLKVNITYKQAGALIAVPTDAGTYELTATIDDPRYEGTATGTLVIGKANATIKADGWSGAYTGTAHRPSVSATGAKGENLGTLLLVEGSFTDVPGGTATWTFKGNANYNSAEGTVPITITKANASINANGWSGAYTGTAHRASVSATGARGESLGSLVTITGSFTDAGAGRSYWSFRGNGNYNPASGSVWISISKANASISISGYNKPYDGKPHGATFNYARGVRQENLSTLIAMGGQTYVDAMRGPASWTFAGNTNYKSDSGVVYITISKANASIHVSGWSGEYDGYSHGASGSASGVLGESLTSLLNFGAQFSSVGTHSAHWTFAGNSNYNSDSGYVSIVITEPPTTTTAAPPSGLSRQLAQ